MANVQIIGGKKAEVEEKRSDAHRTIRGWASKHLAIV
jgi:hypothetical protein